ncbi:MAG: T9SS type A sorting domain-containing protein, partial [Chitinophagales bacterium]
VVNVGTLDVQVVVNAIEAGEDIPALVAGPAICADIVDEPLIITILPAESPDCTTCEPNSGDSSAAAESICEGECIAVNVAGDNQNDGFSTVVLITTSDDIPIVDAISAGDFCLDAGTYTLYSFNLFTTLLPELTAQIGNDLSLNDLQALIEDGTFCGMIEAEGTTVTFLPPNDDACFECDASVGTIVNPSEDVTICFGEELTFQVEGDNNGMGFNTQFLGVSPVDGSIPIFIEDNDTQVLEVGTFQYYAINFAEDEEFKLNDILANGTLADLLALIDDNGFCAEVSATFVTVTVLPADHPSCVGDPFVVDFDIVVAPDGLTYTVTITMSGGSGDYTIDGLTTGSIFESDPIPCGEPFSFEASDGTLIELVEGTSPCPEPCFADAGTMPSTNMTNPICDGDATNFNTTGSNLGEGDVLIYVLHDMALGGGLGNVLATNANTGVFSMTSSMDILTNTVYFVSAVAGPDDDGDGIPDENNDCTSIAAGTPVVFLEPLELLFDINCDLSTGNAMVHGVISGGYPAFDSDGTYSVSGSFSIDLQLPVDSFSFNVADGDVISFDLTDGFCLIQTENRTVACKKNPIELLSFEGEVQAEGNLLQWITATEIDNDYFTLERSMDGKTFEGIAVVQSQGNSQDLQSYKFLDRNAPSGVTYYQLRQTDLNGQQTVSHTISLQRGERAFEIMRVFPNPAKNEVNINFTIQEERMVEISVYNIKGQQFESLRTESTKGINKVELNVSDYPTGVYFVQIFDGSTTQTQKIIKK